jgi:hypothetical protein
MRRFVCVLGLAAAGICQESRELNTYTYDLNGRRVPVASLSAESSEGASSRVERTQTVNGRTIPLEKFEEKVLSDGAEGKVVERVLNRYDQNGRLSQTEKVRIEERKQADGGFSVLTAVYRSDLNGRMALDERSTMRSTRSGDVTTAETVVERPGLSGTLETAERRQTLVRGDENNSQADSTVYRRDSNGNFRATEREVTKTVVEEGRVSVESANYSTAPGGQMALVEQRVSETSRGADGSERTVVNVYGVASQGRAVSNYESGPKLREQQIVSRRPAEGGGYVESWSVRRADLANGNLGPAAKISETVCTGQCAEKKK